MTKHLLFHSVMLLVYKLCLTKDCSGTRKFLWLLLFHHNAPHLRSNGTRLISGLLLKWCIVLLPSHWRSSKEYFCHWRQLRTIGPSTLRIILRRPVYRETDVARSMMRSADEMSGFHRTNILWNDDFRSISKISFIHFPLFRGNLFHPVQNL